MVLKRASGFLREFREFAVKGNVMDMAVGIIVGGAFLPVVKSVVDDLLMPPIGLLTGGHDFSSFFVVLKHGATDPGPYATPAAAKTAGAVTVNFGVFINIVIQFAIVAFAVFLLVRVMNRLRRQPEAPPAPTQKNCPYCKTTIAIEATRCPACTSELEAPAAA